MEVVKLGDLLTDEQLKHVMQLRRENPDLLDFIKRLKEYFATIDGQLEAHNMIVDYAAYVVAGVFMRAEEQNRN